MRFLVDMALSPALAVWLRSQGHDAVHASELGLHQAPDTQLIAFAKSESRTIITADLDYRRLLALAHATEPSVILFRDGNWSETQIVDRKREVLAALTEPEIAQSIVTVERDRVRRRPLPLV